MFNTMFSIPVHERTEVVIDQIVNIRRFCPNSGVVLHISRGFDYAHSFHSREEFLSLLKTFDNVFVNPISLDTGFADIVQTHASNFRHVAPIAEFKNFSLIASNELFVRNMPVPMSDEYDANCGCGIWEQSQKWSWYEHVKHDAFLFRMLQHLNATPSDIKTSQIEGTSYRKELFADIVDVLDRFYDFKEVAKIQRVIYPREEVYYPTLAHLLNKNLRNKNKQFTYMPWDKGLVISQEDVQSIINGNMPDKYSVKRVDRKFNDPLRFYIGTTIGNYRQKSVEVVRSRCLKKFVSLFNLASGKRRIFVGHKQHEDFIRDYFRIKPYEKFMSFIERNGGLFLDDILKTMIDNRDALFVVCTPMYPMFLNVINNAGLREDVDFIDGWFLIPT